MPPKKVIPNTSAKKAAKKKAVVGTGSVPGTPLPLPALHPPTLPAGAGWTQRSGIPANAFRPRLDLGATDAAALRVLLQGLDVAGLAATGAPALEAFADTLAKEAGRGQAALHGQAEAVREALAAMQGGLKERLSSFRSDLEADASVLHRVARKQGR